MHVPHTALEPIAFDALEIWDYTAALGGRSSLARIEVPPSARHARAWSRRSDKDYLVVSGTLHFELDGRELVLGPGDFCRVPQGARFSYENRGPVGVTLVLVHAPAFDLASEVFEDA